MILMLILLTPGESLPTVCESLPTVCMSVCVRAAAVPLPVHSQFVLHFYRLRPRLLRVETKDHRRRVLKVSCVCRCQDQFADLNSYCERSKLFFVGVSLCEPCERCQSVDGGDDVTGTSEHLHPDPGTGSDCGSVTFPAAEVKSQRSDWSDWSPH